MRLAGVDEAGRGSVLGPLVIAGVTVQESDIPKLVRLGVKDSKLLTPAKRNRLFKEIKRVAKEVTWEKIEPHEIDEAVWGRGKILRLNRLEADFAASVLSKLRFDVAYVDSCDTNEIRYGQVIADLTLEKILAKKMSRGRRVPQQLGVKNGFRNRIVSEHHADKNYPVVSAASIVAKVVRDSSVFRLRKIHGEFGSGYPSDPETIAFLESCVHRQEPLPKIVRLSWLTVSRMMGKEEPASIDKYLRDETSLAFSV